MRAGEAGRAKADEGGLNANVNAVGRGACEGAYTRACAGCGSRRRTNAGGEDGHWRTRTRARMNADQEMHARQRIRSACERT